MEWRRRLPLVALRCSLAAPMQQLISTSIHPPSGEGSQRMRMMAPGLVPE